VIFLHLQIQKVSIARGKPVEELEAGAITATRDAEIRIREQSEMFRKREKEFKEEFNAQKRIEQLDSRRWHLEREPEAGREHSKAGTRNAT